MQGFTPLHLLPPEQFPLLYFGFLCLQDSSGSNFCPDIRGKGGHLFRFTCSVVLLGRGDTTKKYRWRVWGVLTVDGPHCHSRRWRVLPASTRLSLQGALWWHCPKWALRFRHFPSISHSFCALRSPSSSGERVLVKRTVPGGPCILLTCPVPAALFPRCAGRAQSQVCVCLLWGADLRLWHCWQIPTAQGPRKVRLATGSLLRVWWKIRSLGLRLQQILAFHLWLLLACLSNSKDRGPYMQAACSPLVFAQSFVLWVCQESPCYSRAFHGTGLFFFFFLSLWWSHSWVSVSH